MKSRHAAELHRRDQWAELCVVVERVADGVRLRRLAALFHLGEPLTAARSMRVRSASARLPRTLIGGVDAR